VVEYSTLHINLPDGKYSVKHMNTVNGELLKEEQLDVAGGHIALDVHLPGRELTLKITRME
jgi:hypothetical protein